MRGDRVHERRNGVGRRLDRHLDAELRAASAVTGPIAATDGALQQIGRLVGAVDLAKLRTADALVNVTTSIRPSSSIP